MTLGSIAILLLLLVSLIAFIYIIVVTARGWGVLHTILLCFLFIECWVFIVFAAGVHYRRVRATEAAHKARLDAESAKEQTQRLLWGDFTTPDALDAVIPVQGQLRRLTANRGRVWRQASYLQPSNEGYQLELSTAAALDPLAEPDPLTEPDPAAPPSAGPSSESLPENTVVYAFAEEASEDGLPKLDFYLGEFAVTQSQAGQVTLKPTLPLYADQEQFITDGHALSWTLYELQPLDSHTAFAAPGSQPSDQEVFGRMAEETLNALFEDVPQEDGRRQAVIEAYLRDGQKASDNDPIEDVWVQVNVLKEYEFDVDSQEVANATERGYFDSIGRAVDSRLKRGEEGRVKLTPDMRGKRIILKAEAAQPLIESGVVELVQRVYVRPLNDYEEAFNQHKLRTHEVSERAALFQRDSAEIDQANQLGQAMINFRQVENQQLASDLSGFQREQSVLEEAASRAEEELQQLRTRLSELYRSIQRKHSEISSSRASMVSTDG